MLPHFSIFRQVGEIRNVASNVRDTLKDVHAYVAERRKITEIKNSLRKIELSASIGSSIPKVFHFILVSQAPVVFQYYMYMAVVSALAYNKGWQAILHTNHEPTGPYWKKISDKLIINIIPPFERYGIANIPHPVHQSDVIRLLALDEIGGVYLDNDTLTAKSYESLLGNKCVMGVQAKSNITAAKLCSAVMMAERGSRFIRARCRTYASFRSGGWDSAWDHHSGRLPQIMSWRAPDDITIVPYYYFFYPLWTNLKQVLLDEGSRKHLPYLQRAFCFHLWSSFTESKLNEIDDKFVSKSTSAYAYFARIARKSL